MVKAQKNTPLPPHDTSKVKPLIKVQIHRWPYPLDDEKRAKEILKAICTDLPKMLDISDWQKRPVPRKPGNGARPARAAGAQADEWSAMQGTDPECWREGYVIGTCEVNGQERACRIEHWVCEDGSFYEQHILLEWP